MQGAKIIVFPEYGIIGFGQSRYSVLPFLEDVPSAYENWNPCNDQDRFPQTRVLHHLSCSAKMADIYIVANIGDIKYCDQFSDKSCPDDGRFQFNTNVVFDNTGQLVARYHKFNLYDESPLFDASPRPEYTVFETPFGKFGTVICFDSLHYYPTQELLQKYDVKNLIITSAWNVFFPFVFPTQMFAGLAKRHNINVLASNIRNHTLRMAGSGIYGPGVEVSTSADVMSHVGELVIAEIDTEIPNDDRENSLEPLIEKENIRKIMNRTYMGIYENFMMNMTYTYLDTRDKGFVSTCTDTVCCALEYEFSVRDKNEFVILGTSDVKFTYPGEIHMQFCAVHLCPSRDETTCGKAAFGTKSVFSKFKLQAFFEDKQIVFPFVSTSPFGNTTFVSEMERYNLDKTNAVLQGESFKHPIFAALIFNSLPTDSDDIKDFSDATRKSSWPVSGSSQLTPFIVPLILVISCLVSAF